MRFPEPEMRVFPGRCRGGRCRGRRCRRESAAEKEERRVRRALIVGVMILIAAVTCTPASDDGGAAQPAPPPGGPIHGLSVLSDQVDDLSSIEAIRAHLARLSSDAERAAEIFRLSNKYRHQA